MEKNLALAVFFFFESDRHHSFFWTLDFIRPDPRLVYNQEDIARTVQDLRKGQEEYRSIRKKTVGADSSAERFPSGQSIVPEILSLF